ncbi:UNVERIFIED_CONTAM: Small subunit processome component 20 [Sesamum latifolium]|uniref:Small subunit processome component 20 n=1 Tax=Sesamum latifolium TaxID=2727402 RepID=A0AAW2VVR0_9LAMI
MAVRLSICDVLDAIAANDSSLLTLVGKPIENSLINKMAFAVLEDHKCELNATSEMEMGGFDYDKILSAYQKINVQFFYTITEEHALPILAQSIHDMSSEELILRQSAFRLLLSFIEFSAEILNRSPKSDLIWSEVSIQHIVHNFFLKHMGNAMDKEGAVKKSLWCCLLFFRVDCRASVTVGAEVEMPNTLKLLAGKAVGDSPLGRTENNIRIASYAKIALLSSLEPMLCEWGGAARIQLGHIVWIDLFRQMVLKLPKVANLDSYRALCSDDAEQDFFNNIVHLQKHRRARALSRFRNIVISGSLSEAITNKVFVPLLFSMLFDLQDGKDEHIRSGCIDALASISGCMKWNQYYALLMRCFRDLTLKPDKQKLLLRLICSILDQYHFSESSLVQIDKKVSACVPPDPYATSLASSLTLRECTSSAELPVIQASLCKNLLPKIQKLLTSDSDNVNVNISLVALKLLKLLPSEIMDLQLPTIIHRISNFLKNRLESVRDEARSALAACLRELGLEFLQFIVKVLKSTLKRGYELHVLGYTLNFMLSKFLMNPICGKLDYCLEELLSVVENDILGDVSEEKRAHLHKQLTQKMKSKLETMLSSIAAGIECNPSVNQTDLFIFTIALLKMCLSSKYESVIIAALRCLPPLVRLPLPSLESQADNIKNSLLVIAQGSVNASSQLTESCIKLLTALLRSTRVTLSADQLHMLIQFPMFVDFAKNPSFAALSLLKAIVHRKLVVPEIYDIVQIVAELMVQSQLEPIRKKCSQILLQFLLGYHLSEKRLQQHLDFLLANLRYEHSTGREAALEMLHAIILKFPRNIIDAQSQTMFVHLVVSLANDDDSKVRSMTAAAIKCLIGHVNTHSLHSILEYSLSWYLGGNHTLWSAAAQVLGLLVEVMRKSFEKNLSRVLPVLRNILQSALSALTSIQQNSSDEAVAPFWKEAYYSLVLLEKLLCQFHNLFFDRELEDIWEICAFLLHPHLWLRNISNRILSVYFAAVTTACRDKEVSMGTFFLMKPSILFLVAVSLCCQLKVPLIDDAAGIIILQNLVFSICGLHSLLVELEFVDVPKFWSNLERGEQERFLKAFGALDPRKGSMILASFTSDASGQHNQQQHPFISYLLQRMGKITFQMDDNQMKIVFNCFKSVSPKLLGCYGISSPIGDDDLHNYAYLLLLPLYRVIEGYTGKIVSDDLKQFAQEVSESIRDIIGMQNFVQVYSQIRKNLKVKRDKRKQQEKIMAVVNPTRNAKRKLRIAAKHRAHKKRKIMTMKMGRWM